MFSITRQQFRNAIEAGINDAGDAMHEEFRTRLREMAETATEFGPGTQTTPKCPLGALGFNSIYDAGWTADFVVGFDTYWSRVIDPPYFSRVAPRRIAVIDS